MVEVVREMGVLCVEDSSVSLDEKCSEVTDVSSEEDGREVIVSDEVSVMVDSDEVSVSIGA